ncbi:MAG: hypothetical protein HXX15_19910 [Rhodopseudomonas sp.]|uniref:hypothetical protein n=1 Tax=Rhodopseudomonas sp. TaxID=1078 RepID=UPI0017BD7369|nr:hypothetical protein [Rhodopseudomonas sp.]NVN88352.1 hypothetical protein [Rhodopseudomonas sp.]
MIGCDAIRTEISGWPMPSRQKSNALRLVAGPHVDAYSAQQQSRTVWWFRSLFAADEILFNNSGMSLSLLWADFGVV